ncbi:MAG: hypothetical protein GWN53_08825 [Gammaproteobacteria bacterium]|nr:hypothetical protein [Gammaproteobacteria bacterium]
MIFVALFAATISLVTAGFAFSSQEGKTEKIYETTDAFQFRVGVIADPDRGELYLMNPQGGIDAVDLTSGDVIWSTAQAAKPLLHYDKILVAQAEMPDVGNILRIVVLSADTGERVFDVDVELPDGVRASVDDHLGETFDASAYMHGGAVIVSWRFSVQQITGVNPGPDPAAGSRRATGAVRVDLGTERVTHLHSDEIPAPSEPAVPDNVASLIESGALRGPLLRAGSVVATVIRTGNDRKRNIILRRWRLETGEPLPDISLFDDGFTFRYASADERHLLGSKAAETNGPAWMWSIYSVETGEHVTEVRRPSPAAPFFIWDSMLFHESPPTGRAGTGSWAIEEPRKVRALDLESGAELWSRAIRDTIYRGPYPPALRGNRGA